MESFSYAKYMLMILSLGLLTMLAMLSFKILWPRSFTCLWWVSWSSSSAFKSSNLGEEILFREVVFNILLNNFSLLTSISIGSLLFALILHLNESLESNLLIRFPSSIILYVIRYKFKLSFSIITHWIYNIFIVVMRWFSWNQYYYPYF